MSVIIQLHSKMHGPYYIKYGDFLVTQYYISESSSFFSDIFKKVMQSHYRP
jgi:hypothetical protein